MKKIYFIFVLLLSLFACEQGDLITETTEQITTSNIQTRSNYSDVISQLEGMPVNIRLYAENGGYRYLSTASRGDLVDLYSKDDESLRQRWYIGHSNGLFGEIIALVGGNEDFDKGMIAVGGSNPPYPKLVPYANYGPTEGGANKPIIPIFNAISNSPYYRISMMAENPLIPSLTPNKYLQPENLNSSTLVFKEGKEITNMQEWEILPIEEFNVINIEYELVSDKDFSVTPVVVATKTFVNETNIPATRTVSFQNSITSSSQFSTTEGISINVGTSVQVGIPVFGGGSINVGATSSDQWSFSSTSSKTESKSYTILETDTQEIPAYTTVIADLIASEYRASLLYVVQVKGKTSGKTLYLKGRWNGVLMQETKVVVRFPNGQILKTIEVEAK